MAKAIPKKGSCGHIGSRKSIRKIPEGVIHIQASFNNTILTVTYVRGRVVSLSSAGTYGFRGTRRGTPFAAQTATAKDSKDKEVSLISSCSFQVQSTNCTNNNPLRYMISFSYR